MDSSTIHGLLSLLARLLELFNIGVIILLANKNAPIRYIYYVLGLTVFSVSAFVISVLIKGLALTVSLIITLFAFVLTAILAIKAIKSPFLDIDIPEGARCLVCSSFIKRLNGVTALQVENTFLFFDSEEHLRRFLQEFEEYTRVRRLQLRKDSIKGAYKLQANSWQRLEV